jgi:5-methylcytosine-specific restriction enzyme A
MNYRRDDWQYLYHSSGWRGPGGRRLSQLTKNPLCAFCMKLGKIIPATVADHIIPHRGDLDLFWFGELQSLCATCHSKTKAEIERDGYHSGTDEHGYPLDPNHPANRH